MFTVPIQYTVKTLKLQGQKNTQIAQTVGCHRNTVAAILKRQEVTSSQTRHKPSYFDPYHNQIKTLLDQKTTRIRSYEILKEEFAWDRTYDSFLKYVQKHFPKIQEAFGVQSVCPGEEAEVDFGYIGLQPDALGNLIKTYVLVLVLSYSRDLFVYLTHDQKITSLIAGIIGAFEFWGGVPKRLKVDNLKAAILKNQHYDLEMNEDFLTFAAHYRTVIVPCSPYNPQQKGKVESGVKYVKGNFFNGRRFTTEAELLTQLRSWVVSYANVRKHGTTQKIPQLIFETEEKTCLQPLPDSPFILFNRGVRKVGKNCHIHVGHNYYSVPEQYVGKEVTIRSSDTMLKIILGSEVIATHALVPGAGEFVTNRSHLPLNKCYTEAEHRQQVRVTFASWGEAAGVFYEEMLNTDPYWFVKARQLSGLVAQFGKERVNLSLKRALAFGVGDMKVIKRIVVNKLYELEAEPPLNYQPVVVQQNLFAKVTGFFNSQLGQSPIREGPDLTRDLSYYQD